MEFLAKVITFLFLFGILFLIYHALVLRNRILLYLKKNYKSEYEGIRLNYTWRDILAGDPDVIKNQFKQNKKLLSEEICYDEYIRTLQKKCKTTIFFTLVTIISYIIFLVFFLRFFLNKWTWYT